MKHHILLVLLFLTFSSLSAIGATDSSSYEFTAATNSYLLLTHYGDGGGDLKEFNLTAGAHYFLEPRFEVGGTFYVNETSNPSSSTVASTDSSAFRLLVGPTYNFSSDAADSFFISTLVGFHLYNSTSAHNYLAFAYNIGVGRRVPLFSHVSWKPEFNFYGHMRATDSTYYWSAANSYQLTLFQFSILL